MSLLATLSTSQDITEAKDSVGSSGPVESGLYESSIALAYLTKAASGALALNLSLKIAGNREVRQQLYITSGDAKGNKNYYEKDDGEKRYLPGFELANHLALLTCDKELSQLSTETKVVNLYNFDAKAEVPTKVEMVMDLLNKEIIAGIIKQTVDKNVKNDATGEYVPSGETREENEIDKFFHTGTKKTVAELKAKVAEATFIHTWEAKWAGKTRNKAKGASGTAGAPKAGGVAKPAAAANKPTTSLFG